MGKRGINGVTKVFQRFSAYKEYITGNKRALSERQIFERGFNMGWDRRNRVMIKKRLRVKK
ncbi:MAG: hypothetical protein ACTSPB_00610 [Candidatus Thorarchaeota archaeon]